MLKSILHALPSRRGYLSLFGMGSFHPGREANDDQGPAAAARRRIRGEGSIVLEDVEVTLGARSAATKVLEKVSVEFPQGRTIGVLGAAKSGKTTLVQLLNGTLRPDGGRIAHGMTVSWPLAARDVLRRELTVRANVRIISRMYGAWPPDVIEAVKEMGKIRAQDFDQPLGDLADEILTRASTSLCLALDFDCYVADENFCGGSRNFRDHVRELLAARRKTHSLIIVTRNLQSIRDMCDDFYVLGGKQVKSYASRRDAILAFKGVGQGDEAASAADEA